MVSQIRDLLMIAAILGIGACTGPPASVIPEPTVETRQLLDCAANATANLGWEILGRGDSGFGARRRILGRGGSELQDALQVSVAKGSDGKPQIVVRAQSYEVHRDPGTPTYLRELPAPSSDARRAAYDVEQACLE